MFICSICNLFGGNTYAAVLRHIGEIHRHDPGLVIRCGINHCPQTYSNYESFRSHVYRKHRDALHREANYDIDTDGHTHDDEDEDADGYNDLAIDYPSQPGYPSQPDMKKIGAKFLLKTREENRMAQSTLNTVVSDMNGLWMSSMDAVKSKVLECLQSDDYNEASIMQCFDDSFPLDGLQTEYQQLNYYKKEFNYLVS